MLHCISYGTVAHVWRRILSIKYYNTSTETKEYIKMVYKLEDFKDLINSLTEKYISIDKMELKQEYR